MDLDIPAWFAYVVIVIISIYIAIDQIETLLQSVPRHWLLAETYGLLVFFFALPIAIVWALDRVGAIHDSSLISALIVAFTYQAIVNGQSATTNSAVAAVFKPVLEWVKQIPQRLAAETQSAHLAFVDAVAAAVGNNAALLPVLENWVASHAKDTLTLAERLAEFDADPATLKPYDMDPSNLNVREWCRTRARPLMAFVEPTLRARWALKNISLGLKNEIPARLEANAPAAQTAGVAVDGASSNVYSTTVTSILTQSNLDKTLASDLIREVFAGRLNHDDRDTACKAMRLPERRCRHPFLQIPQREAPRHQPALRPIRVVT